MMGYLGSSNMMTKHWQQKHLLMHPNWNWTSETNNNFDSFIQLNYGKKRDFKLCCGCCDEIKFDVQVKESIKDFRSPIKSCLLPFGGTQRRKMMCDPNKKFNIVFFTLFDWGRIICTWVPDCRIQLLISNRLVSPIVRNNLSLSVKCYHKRHVTFLDVIYRYIVSLKADDHCLIFFFTYFLVCGTIQQNDGIKIKRHNKTWYFHYSSILAVPSVQHENNKNEERKNKISKIQQRTRHQGFVCSLHWWLFVIKLMYNFYFII